ncbi:hypothetical protein F7P69_11160 [Cellulosimicrobium funkei]|nr:hypothetical protein [Cellulosimicrobium funkei]
MIDLTRVDTDLYAMVTPVVDELIAGVDLDPDNILLIGAGCRDILHASLGHTFRARATTDTDLGIAVGDWTTTQRIEARFRRTGSNGIRYMIAGTPVDIMPFGDIEDPEGISVPAPRREELVVFGFRDVHAHALPLLLPSGTTIRLPQPAGYAALKMRSWIDRSAHFNQDKDAKDLAMAAFWYQNAPEIEDRIYATDIGFDLLTELDMDFDRAAVRLLGLDASAQLSPVNRHDLSRRWAEQDLSTLARDFKLPASGPHTADLDRRKEIVAQLQL